MSGGPTEMDLSVYQFALDDGRTLVIRETTADDADLLAELYEALPDLDRRRRFFGSFRPNDDWYDSWCRLRDEGGYGVIALIHHDAGAGSATTSSTSIGATSVTVAGEAGYSMRQDGDGELAIVVDPAWRGLGSILLDVISCHAAANGITSLQADVMSDNRPMLMALRKRGIAALEHDDGMVRMSIGTCGDVPAWPAREERPKVLVEISGARWAGEAAARDAGLAVAMCPGPPARVTGPCPRLVGEPCPLADEADAIVVALDPSDDRTQQLVDQHRHDRPDIPVLVRPDYVAAVDELAALADEG